jgi:hypothetical protein
MAEIYVHGEEDEILRAIRDKLKRGGCVRLIAEHADDNGGTPSPLTEFGRWFVTNGGILLVQVDTSAEFAQPRRPATPDEPPQPSAGDQQRSQALTPVARAEPSEPTTYGEIQPLLGAGPHAAPLGSPPRRTCY